MEWEFFAEQRENVGVKRSNKYSKKEIISKFKKKIYRIVIVQNV